MGRDVFDSVYNQLRDFDLEEIEKVFDEVRKRVVSKKERDEFPIGIVTEDITVLGAVVKYLREREYSFSKIGEKIGRNEKNVWSTYNSVKKKKLGRKEGVFIPFRILRGKLSALESVVVYLKEEKEMSLHQIGLLLKRDDRTIWTVYNRAKKK
jgi:hypothetical protein